MKEITFSVIEIFISLIVETIILGSMFTWISNRANSKMEQKINSEIKVIEDQNKTIYREIKGEIIQAKTDIISQIKETGGQ